MFKQLLNRQHNDTTWQKIPWHDPDFSRRMLAEHLNQVHDLASRRFETINQHVNWIHHKVLGGQPARMLDLGCGPGFYTSRLRDLGHTCVGMDISPASLAYAREHNPDGDYIHGDARQISYTQEFDLVSMIYGELNAFPPADAQRIATGAYNALKPSGKLLLEVHPYEAIYRFGQHAPSWHTADSGLFADSPYLCLTESRFDVDRVISHYYVYVAGAEDMQQYTTMHQGYTDDEYRHLLAAYDRVLFYPSLTGDAKTEDLFVIVAHK